MNSYESGFIGGFVSRRKQADAIAGNRGRTAVWRIEYNADGSDPQIFVEDV
jgi:hypothetical protein